MSNNQERCPVCDYSLKDHNSKGNFEHFDCPRCGLFCLSGSAIAVLPAKLKTDNDARAKISHALRRSQEVNLEAVLDTYMIDEILKKSLPKPKEQVDLYVRWLGRNISGPGEVLGLFYENHGGIIGAKTERGFYYIVNQMIDSGLLSYRGVLNNPIEAPIRATLSFSGWERYENLQKGAASYRKAFMAMKFGDEKLDSIFRDVFKPAVDKAGFELFSLDEKPKAGLIDDRIRVEIQSSDFLVADLTHDNSGVYWEAGYAEGLGKPVIYTCEKKKFDEHKTHFDTNHHLTVPWDENNPSLAGEELQLTIRATLPHLARQGDDAGKV